MSNPVADQVAAWKQAIQEGQSLAPVEKAKRLMGDKLVMAVPMRLGGTGFHPVIRIVPVSDCDVSKYSGQLREELDKIGWQFVTILNNDLPAATQRRFAMAPITHRSVTVVYPCFYTRNHSAGRAAAEQPGETPDGLPGYGREATRLRSADGRRERLKVGQNLLAAV